MHNITFMPSSSNAVFYPIGNTPAVNLLAYHSLSSSGEAATESLLLACGDSRSILYSLWSEGRPGNERFNFTCCDLEPAVLARNVLLFSLMIDFMGLYNSEHGYYKEPKLAAIWNLCYHFYVPQENLDLLQEQASKLLSFSETPQSWSESQYAAIKFVSLQTVDELRKIWLQFAEKRSDVDHANYESSRRSEIKKIYNEIYEAGGETLSFSCGPHWQKGLDTANEALRRYWKTGVVAGNATDLSQLNGKSKGCVNPMFVVSSVSKSFVIHFATDPLSGFHLASAFDGPKNAAKEIEEMVDLAKSQFMEWCKAFVDYAKCGSVSVNIYFGDAVNFCHELVARNPSMSSSAALNRLYTSPWSAKPLQLDGNGAQALPSTFDVIDTSNLADWVGIHNLISATAPLLSRKSTSILYTETLRLSATDPEVDLTESLFTTIETASLIIGLAPTGHLLGYTTESSYAEDMIHLEGTRRYRIRIPWRRAALGDSYVRAAVSQDKQELTINFEAEELAELFFSIYMKMFAQENLKTATQMYASSGKPRTYPQTYNRYSRLSFVSLLQQAKRSVKTDWDKFFPALFKKIRDDQTLHIGSETFSDLTFHLHMSGLYETMLPIFPSQTAAYRVFTFVTLIVPRQRLKIFEKLGGLPGIHLAIIQEEDENRFFSIDCFFGSLDASEGNDSCGQLSEDPQGWAGASDLIVTCAVPSLLLPKFGKWYCALKVTLSLNTSAYFEELGVGMTIYKTANKDKKRLITSMHPPGISPSHVETVQFNKIAALSLEGENDVEISASQKKGQIMFKATYTIAKGSPEAIALQNAALVTLTDILPCSLFLNIGSEHSRRFLFPYPINGSKATTRIARKSLWIEVKVPLASALTYGGYDLDPFVVTTGGTPQPSVWALPRVNLPKQPLVRTKDAQWLGDILGQIMSRREKNIKMRGAKSDDFASILPAFKTTLDHMFTHTGRQHEVKKPGPTVFVLAGEESRAENSDTLIISSALRHNRENSSIVLDAWVVPMTRAMRDSFFALLPKTPGLATVFQLSQAEAMLWRQILPAAIESCRYGWEHTNSCAYLGVRKVTLSLERWESPICGCGKGKDDKGFPEEPFLESFKNCATRIALPALSAVSYIEAMDPAY